MEVSIPNSKNVKLLAFGNFNRRTEVSGCPPGRSLVSASRSASENKFGNGA